MSIIDHLKHIIKAVRFRSRLDYYNFLKDIDVDFSDVKPNHMPAKPHKKMRIAFLISDLVPFAGGITSVLRLGTFLSEFGYDIHYLSFGTRPQREMENNARFNLPHFKGKVLGCSHLKEEFDIGIATCWESAYVLYSLDNIHYRAYFVQDFEPYFYPYGDEYILARNSYFLGCRHISLGQWNKIKLEELDSNIVVDCIDFPYEPRQYGTISRTIDTGGLVRLAVYIKEDAKRAPYALMLGLAKVKKELRDKVDINVFGLSRYYRISFGKNLGVLDADSLRSLYLRSHMGIVASMTNISLVPYEMVASGLPVIEFAEGSYPFFFSETAGILVDTLPSDLMNKVVYYINHPDELNMILHNAQKELKEKTWERSAQQFEQLLFT